ncbi:hypothetical protein [Paenibacillus sp. GD4]|uniref:hypothetical protein n=1 Tax=Paenibacillus sp. GD4 TaxID=3068890 RepID=UPI0027BB1B99|nr:hypothetical protein [Paenibacillus sp. GD4]
MEPTGHYWLNLAYYSGEQQVLCGVVNPLHVKKSKELDDNSPTKSSSWYLWIGNASLWCYKMLTKSLS